jgi:hypothetical protein
MVRRSARLNPQGMHLISPPEMSITILTGPLVTEPTSEPLSPIINTAAQPVVAPTTKRLREDDYQKPPTKKAKKAPGLRIPLPN